MLIIARAFLTIVWKQEICFVICEVVAKYVQFRDSNIDWY